MYFKHELFVNENWPMAELYFSSINERSKKIKIKKNDRSILMLAYSLDLSIVFKINLKHTLIEVFKGNIR